MRVLEISETSDSDRYNQEQGQAAKRTKHTTLA
jgi:hypothetical protein